MPDGREPSIGAVRVAPGHDGQAELVVVLAHAGGATDRVTLDAAMSERLLARCGVDDIDSLVGQSWRHLLHVLETRDEPRDQTREHTGGS